MKIENLLFRRIVIHEIFRRDDEKKIVRPTPGNSLVALDGRALLSLQKRITDALGSQSYAQLMDVLKTDIDSAYQCSSRLASLEDADFVTTSYHLAEKLAEAQTSRQIPGGVLVVIHGTFGVSDTPCIILIKAEVHEGFSKQSTGGVLNLQHLQDLLLTPAQKLYKIGLFSFSASQNSLGAPTALVYDHNMSGGDTKAAATYFYQTFLGCSVPKSDKTTTQDFYIATREFINSVESLSDQEKFDMNLSLYAYMKSQQSIIHTLDFAEKFVPEAVRKDYLDHLERSSIPDVAFSKDMSLIAAQLKVRKLRFGSNVTLTAAADDFAKNVQIEKYLEEEGVTPIKVKGRIVEQA